VRGRLPKPPQNHSHRGGGSQKRQRPENDGSDEQNRHDNDKRCWSQRPHQRDRDAHRPPIAHHRESDHDADDVGNEIDHTTTDRPASYLPYPTQPTHPTYLTHSTYLTHPTHPT
jgi:hypothetical protein